MKHLTKILDGSYLLAVLDFLIDYIPHLIILGVGIWIGMQF